MDDPGPNTAVTSLILKIVLLLVLILVNAFFAMSEIAIISLNDAKLEKQAQEGNKKAKKLLKLTSNPSKFLSTIQIGVTLAGFLSSASASQSFVDMLSGGLEKISILTNIPSALLSSRLSRPISHLFSVSLCPSVLLCTTPRRSLSALRVCSPLSQRLQSRLSRCSHFL